jgi:type IV pilus assembly protein PilN
MFKKIIKKLLNFLSKLTVEQEEVVGVDIAPSCIRIAQLESSKKKWTLTKLGYKYIDGISLDNVVENPELYVNKLQQLLTSSKIKTKSAAVSIPVSSAIIKVVDLPLMTDEELKEAVATDSLWENSVQLADNLEEYSIFWQVLKRDTAENQMNLLFVASKLDDIDHYLNIIRQSGLNPVVVDVRCFATRNALALRNDLDKDNSPVAIVEFGAFENYLLILHQDSPFISDIYISEKDRNSLMDPEASEELLKSISGRFAMQISQMISSYQSKYKIKEIGSLLLSSTMPVIDRILVHFNEAMPDITVEVFNPLTNVKIPENLVEKSSAELNSSIFSSALGLATRKLDVFGYYEYVTGTNNINLLPNRENVKNQEKMKFLSRWGIVIFVIIAIALGGWNFLISEKEVERVDKLLVEYNLLEGIKNERQMTLTDLNIKKNSLEGTLKATNNMTSNQGFMYSVLLGINTAVPNQYLKLTKIEYEGGDELIVFGLSTNDGNILKFIDNLTKVEVIDKASLVTMTVETISEQSLKSFTIKCTLASQETIDSRGETDGN